MDGFPLATELTEFGQLIVVVPVPSAFILAFTLSLIPVRRSVRTAGLVAGPLIDFGVFAYFIRADGPCVGECYDQYVLGLIALVTFGSWLFGAGIGYLVREVIAYRGEARRERRDAPFLEGRATRSRRRHRRMRRRRRSA